ncbi:MAG: NAD-dependent epimerase/dehydratase family protein [Acidimicrobiia bacterium]
MHKVFVTGAASWTGGQLVLRLEQRRDVEVIAVDDTQPRIRFRSRFERLSLERLAVARLILEVEPSFVVHLQSVHRTAEEGRTTEGEERIVGALALFGAIERLKSVRSVVVKSDTAYYGASPRNPSVLAETTRPKGTPSRYQRDLTEMERFVTEMADRHDHIRYTILRFAPLFGPSIANPFSRYLTLPIVPTLLGFDPRIQVTHEHDAVAAIEHAIDRDTEGTFNVASDGQLYLSRVLRLGRRIPQPLPGRLFDSALGALARADIVVPSHVKAVLKHGRVVDTRRMRSPFGFEPSYTCRQTVLDAYGRTGSQAS